MECVDCLYPEEMLLEKIQIFIKAEKTQIFIKAEKIKLFPDTLIKANLFSKYYT